MPDLPPELTIDGKYRIIEHLGAGGMGSVYKAEQIGLGRIVALKFLHDFLLNDKESILRFKREALALSKLHTPHVSLFYGYGIFQDQLPYIVMEYLQGRTLQQELSDEGTLNWKRTLVIGRQLANALDYCHHAGTIHRDLKPGNVFLLTQPEPDFVKVTDFGLVKFTVHMDETTLTQSGSLMGSAHYMSPEQCQGEPADASSDIYALGCILYQLLSGNHPYDADTAFGIMYKKVNGPIPELVVAAPSELLELVKSCLSTAQASRPASMKILAEQIDQIHHAYESPSRGFPEPTKNPTGAKEQRRGMVLAICSATLLLLITVCARITAHKEITLEQVIGIESLAKAEQLLKIGQRESAIKVLHNIMRDARKQPRLKRLLLESQVAEMLMRCDCPKDANDSALIVIEELNKLATAVEFQSKSAAQRHDLVAQVMTPIKSLRLPPSQDLKAALSHILMRWDRKDSTLESLPWFEFTFHQFQVFSPHSSEYNRALLGYFQALHRSDNRQAVQLLSEEEDDLVNAMLTANYEPVIESFEHKFGNPLVLDLIRSQNNKVAWGPKVKSSEQLNAASSASNTSNHFVAHIDDFISCYEVAGKEARALTLLKKLSRQPLINAMPQCRSFVDQLLEKYKKQ